MIRPPPMSTRSDTLCPYPAPLRSTIGDQDQLVMPLRVAEIVVDLLEAVEVDKEQRNPLTGPSCLEEPIGLALEVDAVRQRRDRIVERHDMDIVEVDRKSTRLNSSH